MLGSEALALIRDDFFVLCTVDCVRKADYTECILYFHLPIIIPLLVSTHISPSPAVCSIPNRVAQFQMLSLYVRLRFRSGT